MYIIGLTGGISSGKSTVLKTLRSLGATIIEVDKTAHIIMEPGQPAWKELVDYFGDEILTVDQKINRTILGTLVFNHPDWLKKLNQITHPRVIEYLESHLNELRKTKPQGVIVLEVPLLYESGMNQMCDQVWVVWVDYETQLRRLRKRDGVSHEDAVKRIASQMSLDEKAKRADMVVDNTGTPEATASATTKYYHAFLHSAKVE